MCLEDTGCDPHDGSGDARVLSALDKLGWMTSGKTSKLKRQRFTSDDLDRLDILASLQARAAIVYGISARYCRSLRIFVTRCGVLHPNRSAVKVTVLSCGSLGGFRLQVR